MKISLPTSLAVLPLLAAGSALAGDCLDQFRNAVHGRPLAEKNSITMALKAKDIECLYKAAGGEAVEPSFFLDEKHRAAGAVQRFSGKNTLAVGKRFEKHFFSPKGSTVVFGYNEGPVNHLFSSPGFFQILPNESDRSRINFDYGSDFVTVLKDVNLSAIRGATFKEPQNNGYNLIFGGLSDVMKKIDSDIAVGLASKNGKPQSGFILVRKP